MRKVKDLYSERAEESRSWIVPKVGIGLLALIIIERPVTGSMLETEGKLMSRFRCKNTVENRKLH